MAIDRSWRWMAWVILGIGGLIVAGGLALGWGSLRHVLYAERADGEGIEIRREGDMYAPVLRFRRTNGETQEGKDLWAGAGGVRVLLACLRLGVRGLLAAVRRRCLGTVARGRAVHHRRTGLRRDRRGGAGDRCRRPVEHGRALWRRHAHRGHGAGSSRDAPHRAGGGDAARRQRVPPKRRACVLCASRALHHRRGPRDRAPRPRRQRDGIRRGRSRGGDLRSGQSHPCPHRVVPRPLAALGGGLRRGDPVRWLRVAVALVEAPRIMILSDRGPPGPLMIFLFAGSAPLQWRVFASTAHERHGGGIGRASWRG